jgi:hypothetical protein
MRENPERLAWSVLLTSAFVFCLLAVSIPLGVRQYVVTAAKSYPARVTAYYGAVLVSRAGDEVPGAIKAGQSNQEVQEGTTIVTQPSSEAFLRLFEDSSLQIWNDSQVTIVEASTPRFETSPRSTRIVVEVQVGRVIVGVSPAPQDRPRLFEVRTPHGQVFFDEGNYSITVTEADTEVSVRTVRAVGHARLETETGRVELALGQRGRMEAGRSPEGPLPGEHNLLVNGDFQQPLSNGWILWETHDDKDESAGSASVETIGGRQVIHFARRGGNRQHAENGVLQELNLDVRDVSSLEVRLSVNLIYQSLSGGGWLSSEFPLMVRLRYRDAQGAQRDWVRGFYYANWEGRHVNDEEANRGVLIPQSVWRPFESENLMLTLGDLKPAHLISLAVYASGHDYESMAADVSLLVKE